jgi:hypothetical protein
MAEEFSVVVCDASILVVHTAGHRYAFDRTGDGSGLQTDVMVTPNHASSVHAWTLVDAARKAALEAVGKTRGDNGPA